MNIYDDGLIYISIDDKEYTSKPKGSEIGAIQMRLAKKMGGISIQEFSRSVGSYKAFKTSILSYGTAGSKNEFIASKIIALDFDNKERENYVTKLEITNRDFTKRNGCFIYDSISNTEDKEKFRLIFILKDPIINQKDFKTIYTKLREIYPESDSKTASSSNLFFGGSNSTEINFNNRLDVSEILEDFETINNDKLVELIESNYNSTKEESNFGNDKIWKLIKQNKIAEAEKKSKKFNKCIGYT